MRDDTSFSDRKLSEKEFSDKYWMKGKFKYQYHTAGIEDARDEREQFVFNNVRALYDLYNDLPCRIVQHVICLYDNTNTTRWQKAAILCQNC